MKSIEWREIIQQNKSYFISKYGELLKDKQYGQIFSKHIGKILEIIEKQDERKLEDLVEEVSEIPPYKNIKVSSLQECFLDFKEIFALYLKEKIGKIDFSKELTLKEIENVLFRLIFKMSDFYFASHEKIIIEQKSVLDRKIQELSMLLVISSAMNKMLDLDKLLNLIADEVLSLVNYYSFSIMLLNEEGELELKVISGYREKKISQIKFKIGQGVAGWVAQNKKPLYIPVISKDERFIEPYGEVKCIFAIPLFAGERFIGVLNVDSDKINAFPKEDRDILELLSLQAAVSITNARLYEEIKRKNQLDPLTQIYNNNYFEDFFDQEMKKNRRGEIPFSLFIINIDNFCKISNQSGFQQSDEILKKIGDLLKKNMRKIDCVARLGEDEFGIIQIGVNGKEIEREGLKIKKIIEEYPWEIKGEKLTCSIGCTAYPEKGREKEKLIAQARSAMVLAKKKGKNRVCFYSEETKKH
ncbi:sensor domain-containing diguanylate cyclase [bacterium]|nr:sensor domain-containing diguanylate cyclase [bacterium]